MITTQAQAFRIAAMTRRYLDPADAAEMRAVAVPISSLPIKRADLRLLALNISRDELLGDSVTVRTPASLAENQRLERQISALEVASFLRGLHGSTPRVKQARTLGNELLTLVLSLSKIPVA